jgi:hypothetical protein
MVERLCHGYPGWWLSPTPLKNMKVSWDDEVPNIWKHKKTFQTTNQGYISAMRHNTYEYST